MDDGIAFEAGLVPVMINIPSDGISINMISSMFSLSSFHKSMRPLSSSSWNSLRNAPLTAFTYWVK